MLVTQSQRIFVFETSRNTWCVWCTWCTWYTWRTWWYK